MQGLVRSSRAALRVSVERCLIDTQRLAGGGESTAELVDLFDKPASIEAHREHGCELILVQLHDRERGSGVVVEGRVCGRVDQRARWEEKESGAHVLQRACAPSVTRGLG